MLKKSPSFRKALAGAFARVHITQRFPVIPDIKLRSPKEGALMGDRDPVRLAQALVQAGAPAISVVTESENFGGSLQLLEAVAKAVPVPVLRKDFVKSTADIAETKQAGGSAILLMAAHLPPAELEELHHEAHRYGLETLVEVHTAAELASLAHLEFDALGINNREIVNLEQDAGTVTTTEQLAPLVPPNNVLVSESGLYRQADVQRAAQAGATAALVGTAILQAEDPVAYWAELAAVPKKIGDERQSI